MNDMFSPEVRVQLKCYVYRLVDPRNGQTFYVGKGKDNRVFEHAKAALKNLDKEEIENLKIKRIRDIMDAGLNVIHIIHKYGLNERDAYLIECALIDAYNVSDTQMTNKVRGHEVTGYNDMEPVNSITLQRDLGAKEFVEDKDYPFIIIKIKQYWLDQRNNDRYETTRSSWVLSLSRAMKIPYVLSVTNGVVKEVYKVTEWHETQWERRIEFTGSVADENVRKLFINKKIPEKYRKKGASNPALYCNFEN